MITIKQYANGRFYHTEEKKYLKKTDIMDLINKKRKMKITASKTGKDITKKVMADLKSTKKAAEKKPVPQETVKKWVKDNKKWIRDNVDVRISKALNAMNLPSKKEITGLITTMNQLNKKVDELKKKQAKKVQEMQKQQAKQMKTIEQNHRQQIQDLEKQQTAQIEELESKIEEKIQEVENAEPSEA